MTDDDRDDAEGPARPSAGSGEQCPECGGSGRRDDEECPACEGTGNVMRGLGGG